MNPCSLALVYPKLVSAQYLVKELMDLSHILHNTNFPLKQWTQKLSDTGYRLPILLKYHIPETFQIFYFVHFSYKLTHQSSEYCKIVFFSSNKNLCDIIPAGATPLSADFLFTRWFGIFG